MNDNNSAESPFPKRQKLSHSAQSAIPAYFPLNYYSATPPQQQALDFPVYRQHNFEQDSQYARAPKEPSSNFTSGPVATTIFQNNNHNASQGYTSYYSVQQPGSGGNSAGEWYHGNMTGPGQPLSNISSDPNSLKSLGEIGPSSNDYPMSNGPPTLRHHAMDMQYQYHSDNTQHNRAHEEWIQQKISPYMEPHSTAMHHGGTKSSFDQGPTAQIIASGSPKQRHPKAAVDPMVFVAADLTSLGNKSPYETRKSHMAEFIYFFENPQILVNSQAKYIRNQLHLGFIKGLYVAESDFSEGEGCITLWKMKDTNIPASVGNPFGIPMAPIATFDPAVILSSTHVAKLISDSQYMYCASGGDNLWVSFWDLQAFKEEKLHLSPKLANMNIETPWIVSCFYVDDEYLYVALSKGHIVIIEKGSKKICKLLKLKSNFYAHIMKSDDVFLYAGFSDSSVRLWYKHKNWRKKKQVCMDKNEKNHIRGIEVDEESVYLAYNRAIHVFKKSNKTISEFTSLKLDSDLFSMGSDRDYLLLGYRGRIELRNKTTLGVVRVIQVKSSNPIRSLTVDDKYIYVDSYPLRVFARENLLEVAVLGEELMRPNQVSAAGIRTTWSDSTLTIGGCRNGFVYIWRRRSNSLAACIPPPTPVEQTMFMQSNVFDNMVTAIAANSAYIFIGYYGGLIRVIDRANLNYDTLLLLPNFDQQNRHKMNKRNMYITNIFADDKILVTSFADGLVLLSLFGSIVFGTSPGYQQNFSNSYVLHEQNSGDRDRMEISSPIGDSTSHRSDSNAFKTLRNGSLLFVALTSGHIVVYLLDVSPRRMAALPCGQYSSNSSFYIDDHLVYFSTQNEHNQPVVRMWRQQGLAEIPSLITNHSDPVYTMFTDKNFLYTCTKFGELRVWNKMHNFDLEHIGRCNWREVESLSRIPFNILIKEELLPAYCLAESKNVDWREIKSRGESEATSILPPFSVNDSSVVVSRVPISLKQHYGSTANIIEQEAGLLIVPGVNVLASPSGSLKTFLPGSLGSVEGLPSK
jgi:hypothetical protein